MINNLMNKKGYKLIKEDKYGVIYEKEEPQNFTHIVTIVHKKSGKHIMQSYDKEVKNGRNEVCGVEISVLLLMWFKAKYLSFKYNW